MWELVQVAPGGDLKLDTILELSKSTYIAPQAAYCSCSGTFVSQTKRRAAYRPWDKPAPTDFDLRPNSHTQPWSAV